MPRTMKAREFFYVMISRGKQMKETKKEGGVVARYVIVCVIIPFESFASNLNFT